MWLPILSSDTRTVALEAAAGVPDARASHSWDTEVWLSNSLGEVLSLLSRSDGNGTGYGVAWDVYLAYERGVTWTSAAPPSTLWMHQLSQGKDTQAPHLDGPALRAHMERSLAPAAAAKR